jgi:nucleotide-binding universal stress UspA family protein
LELARDIARQHNAIVVVTHAHFPTTIAYGEAPIPLEIESAEDARNKLNQISMQPGVTIRRQFQPGTVVESILEAARNSQADLIVMGTHGRSGMKRFALGSVAEQIVRRADCPVLLTRPLESAKHFQANVRTHSAAAVVTTK